MTGLIILKYVWGWVGDIWFTALRERKRVGGVASQEIRGRVGGTWSSASPEVRKRLVYLPKRNLDSGGSFTSVRYSQ